MNQMMLDDPDLDARTQNQRVLDALRQWPAGVCGTQFLEMHIPRYAARVGELRDDGHTIDNVACPHGWHRHNSRIATYQLTEEATR
jgi:hypothetical protein